MAVPLKRLIFLIVCSPNLFIQHFRVILKVDNIFFLEELNMNWSVSIIFMCKCVHRIYAKSEKRGKFLQIYLLSSPKSILEITVQWSFIFHFSSSLGKTLLLRCKYRCKRRLYLTKKQRKACNCPLVLFLVSWVWKDFK